MTAGQGVLKKIGIRADSGEVGGCESGQFAELARQVRLVGIAVLAASSAQPGFAGVVASAAKAQTRV